MSIWSASCRPTIHDRMNGMKPPMLSCISCYVPCMLFLYIHPLLNLQVENYAKILRVLGGDLTANTTFNCSGHRLCSTVSLDSTSAYGIPSFYSVCDFDGQGGEERCQLSSSSFVMISLARSLARTQAWQKLYGKATHGQVSDGRRPFPCTKIVTFPCKQRKTIDWVRDYGG